MYVEAFVLTYMVKLPFPAQVSECPSLTHISGTKTVIELKFAPNTFCWRANDSHNLSIAFLSFNYRSGFRVPNLNRKKIVVQLQGRPCRFETCLPLVSAQYLARQLRSWLRLRLTKNIIVFLTRRRFHEGHHLNSN